MLAGFCSLFLFKNMQRTITEMFNFKRKERIEESVVKKKICRRNEEFEQLEEEDSDDVNL